MSIVAPIAVAMLMAVPAFPVGADETPSTQTDLAVKAQALGACFVNKSTGEDRIAVARWMLAAMASAPQMADVAKVDPARKIALDKGMAAIFTRLITVDCANESRPLFKAKSQSAFEVAGEALGKIAMKELLSDPKASQGLSDYAGYLDENAFTNVVK